MNAVNKHFGRNNLSSKYDAAFMYKEVDEYSAEEWLENIFIAPSENSACLDQFSFMDKRSGVSFSKMGVGMPASQIHELMDNPEDCRWLIKRYFEKRYYHASKSGNFLKAY